MSENKQNDELWILRWQAAEGHPQRQVIGTYVDLFLTRSAIMNEYKVPVTFERYFTADELAIIEDALENAEGTVDDDDDFTTYYNVAGAVITPKERFDITTSAHEKFTELLEKADKGI